MQSTQPLLSAGHSRLHVAQVHYQAEVVHFETDAESIGEVRLMLHRMRMAGLAAGF